MTARDEAVAVIGQTIYDHASDPTGVKARAIYDAALPVLLDGLDERALAFAATGHRHVMPPTSDPDGCRFCREALEKADAVIAHLRDEWSS